MTKGYYFAKSEEKADRRGMMVVLDVRFDNFYAFKDFHMNMTYPKKIVGSCIPEEHLDGRPNFRYKKVNIIMGANATGKTTFGRMLMTIFNFIEKKNFELLADVVSDGSREAFFSLDLVIKSNTLYRISCRIAPCTNEKYNAEDFLLEIRKEPIRVKDSYESCVKRIEAVPYLPQASYIDELGKLEPLDWIFEYPEDINRTLSLPDKDEKFRFVLEQIIKALDPSVLGVDILNDVEKSYVIRLKERAVILQDKTKFDTRVLSSGTKAGVEVALVVSGLMQGHYSFCYCDEKFPYIHTEIEKAILSLMIEYLRPNDQLFFTTHNSDMLDMNLPKHAFTFMRKNVENTGCPITCVDAASILKRSTDSLKNAVENDLFSCAPALDLIYALTKQ